MKFLRMRIRRQDLEGRTHYTYPSCYEANKIIIGPIYEGGLEWQEKKIRDRKKEDEYILVGIDDSNLSQFLKAQKLLEDNFYYGVEEVDLNDAKTIGDNWTEQTEKITDEKKVLMICAKAIRGEALSQAEKDAIDPEKDTPGIIRTKKFSEILDEI